MKQKANDLNDLEVIYSPQQVADYLRIGVRQIKQMLLRNEIRHKRFGIHYWVPISALQEWLQSQNGDATPKGKQ